MPKSSVATLNANGIGIRLINGTDSDFLSLTDLAKVRSDEPNDVIRNWMRLRDTLEFLGRWEALFNDEFDFTGFSSAVARSGTNTFTMSPSRWIEVSNAKGFIVRSGRYGGTYAHVDIALEFASWLSPEFRLYVNQDYKRVKAELAERLSEEWNLSREIAKINYRIHTDSIKDYLISEKLTKRQQSFVYANEADMMNVVIFGQTAKEWKQANPTLKGNPRDFATTAQNVVLSNLESLNATLIAQGMDQATRMNLLRETAIQQLESLARLGDNRLDRLPGGERFQLGDGEE